MQFENEHMSVDMESFSTQPFNTRLVDVGLKTPSDAENKGYYDGVTGQMMNQAYLPYFDEEGTYVIPVNGHHYDAGWKRGYERNQH